MNQMKNRILLAAAAIAALLLVACVTVNVYFPAAEVKDLSKKDAKFVAVVDGPDALFMPLPHTLPGGKDVVYLRSNDGAPNLRHLFLRHGAKRPQVLQPPPQRVVLLGREENGQ